MSIENREAIQNNNFENLVNKLDEKREKECNIFKILRVDNYEIRHSNFLAWLFDKNASHGIGYEFLKEFFTEAKIDFPIEYLNKNIKIETESKIEIIENNKKRIGRIDLLLIGENFICVIENKYGSFEHDNQCQDYKKFIETKYNESKKDKYFIFLDLAQPADFNFEEERYRGYKFVSYENILNILKKILKSKNNNEISSILLNQYVEILDKKYNKIDEDIKHFYENNSEFINEMWEFDFNELNENEKEAIYALMDYHKIKKSHFNHIVKENLLENIVEKNYITMKGYDWAYAINLNTIAPNLPFTELDFPLLNNKLNIQLYIGLTKSKSNWYTKDNLNNSKFWDNLTQKGYSFRFTPYIKNGAGYPTIGNFAVKTSNSSFVDECLLYEELWGKHEAKNIIDNPRFEEFLKKNFKDNYQILTKNLSAYNGKYVYIYPAVCVNYEFSEDISNITADDIKGKITEILKLFGDNATPNNLFKNNS